MPQDPLDWPVYVPRSLAPNFTRKDVQELIDRVLGRKVSPLPEPPSSKLDFLFAPKQPKGLGPRIIQTEGGPDNPAQERAVRDALSQYPNLNPRIDKVYLSNDANMYPSDEGAYYRNSGNIQMRGVDPKTKKPYDYGESKNTIRHEMGHAAGLNDKFMDSPNAYDIGSLSDLLQHRSDIHLHKPGSLPHMDEDDPLTNSEWGLPDNIWERTVRPNNPYEGMIEDVDPVILDEEHRKPKKIQLIAPSRSRR